MLGRDNCQAAVNYFGKLGAVVREAGMLPLEVPAARTAVRRPVADAILCCELCPTLLSGGGGLAAAWCVEV